MYFFSSPQLISVQAIRCHCATAHVRLRGSSPWEARWTKIAEPYSRLARARKSDAGCWSEMAEASRSDGQRARCRTCIERSAEDKREAFTRSVAALVEEGELTHAARVFKSANLPPSSPETLEQLRSFYLGRQGLRTPSGRATLGPLLLRRVVSGCDWIGVCDSARF